MAQWVLEYYGTEKTQQHIARELHITTGDLEIVELLTYLRTQGLSVAPHQSDNDTASLLTLEKYVEEGLPVIVLQRRSLRSDEGHYRVVVGMNADRIVVLDPLVGLLYIPREDFLLLWEANTATVRSNQMLAVKRAG